MDSGIRLVWMAEVFIQCQRIAQSFLVSASTLSLEHGHLLEQVIAGLCVGHLAEVVLEFLEDTTFSGCIPLEVVTLAELFYSCFLFLR